MHTTHVPRFARRIARRYHAYRILAIIAVLGLLPVACISAIFIQNHVFKVILAITLVMCAMLIWISTRSRRRARQAEIGEQAEITASNLLRSAFPDFVCAENVPSPQGDIDIVLSSDARKIILVFEVKSYFKADLRINDARKQACRAAYAVCDTLKTKGVRAFVVEREQDIVRAHRDATIVLPLVFLPNSKVPSDDPFVLTQRDTSALRTKIDRLCGARIGSAPQGT